MPCALSARVHTWVRSSHPCCQQTSSIARTRVDSASSCEWDLLYGCSSSLNFVRMSSASTSWTMASVSMGRGRSRCRTISHPSARWQEWTIWAKAGLGLRRLCDDPTEVRCPDETIPPFLSMSRATTGLGCAAAGIYIRRDGDQHVPRSASTRGPHPTAKRSSGPALSSLVSEPAVGFVWFFVLFLGPLDHMIACHS
jgi:hypothetical protein